jgi:hypothetical protein
MQFQEAFDVEAPHDVCGAAVLELGDVRQRADADVEQWNAKHDRNRIGPRVGRVDERVLCGQVVMGDLSGFGKAGGAGGEEECGDRVFRASWGVETRPGGCAVV